MSSAELTEWMVFSKMEPFGSEVDLLGHAIVAATIANVNRQKGTKPYNPSDFMPKFSGETRKEQTVEEQVQIAAMMTIGLGGQDLREGSENG